MSKPPSFPIALLGKDKAERLSYFERYRIAHPVLKAIDQRLWEVIGQAITPSLVFVFGPTGVGKTTLIERLAARLMALDSSPVKERDAYLPVLTVEAASPETGNFNWKGFYRESLIALDKSFLSQKPDYGNNKIFFDDLGNLRIPATMPVYELRTTLEGLLRKRRPNAFIIDEAHHLAKISSGRKLLDQMDALKSLANRAKTTLVLVGHYDLLVFRNLSGQLGRRSIDLHFPRYGSSPKDLKSFQSVLYTFQRQLPLAAEPDLIKHWLFCYARSVGCVGILKDWLTRALTVALYRDEATMPFDLLQQCAPSLDRCERVAAEALAAEEQLSEKSDRADRLMEILGLPIQKPAEQAAAHVSREQAGQTTLEVTPRIHRRVGQRKPKRDPVKK